MTHSPNHNSQDAHYRYGPPRPIYGPNHPSPAEDDGWEWWLIIDPEPLPQPERTRQMPHRDIGEKHFETGHEPEAPPPLERRNNVPP